MLLMTTSDLPLRRIARGKVRDVYEVEGDRLLLVATDRVSAYDVVMAEPIPMKGPVLTQVSGWWLRQLGDAARQHMISADAQDHAGTVPALKPATIIADHKFESGRAKAGEILLIDEVMTPDSSRFWPADGYAPGKPQPSFDKQPLRDWLDVERHAGRWNGDAPPPKLPTAVVDATSKRYLEAYPRLTRRPLKGS